MRKVGGTLTVAACLFLNISAAHAAKWVNTGHNILIDVDSIRKAADGLVYYNDLSELYPELGPSTRAYDCQKGISYYSLTDPNWKSKGNKIMPGTMGNELLKFVCSRVR